MTDNDGITAPWELTEREARAEAKELERIKRSAPVKFYAIPRINGNGWMVSCIPDNPSVEGHASFWNAYAECAQMEGDSKEFEYGLKMANRLDSPLYDYKPLVEVKPEYPEY